MEEFFRYGEERFLRYSKSGQNIFFSTVKFLFPYYAYQNVKQLSYRLVNSIICFTIYFMIILPIGIFMRIYSNKKNMESNFFWLKADKNE